MHMADVVGYIAAVVVFATFGVKTMVPLRVLGIVSNFLFIAYGFLAAAYPPLVLHVLLLPLNLLRLREMLRVTKQVEQAATGDHNMSWIKPFTSTRRVTQGELLFAKGDVADRLFFVVSGRYRLIESGIELSDGSVIGELAFLSPDKTRTQSLNCVESGELLQITYGQLKQLYFQNPTFGFYFLQLASARLFDNIKRLEKEVAEMRTRLANVADARPTSTS